MLGSLSWTTCHHNLLSIHHTPTQDCTHGCDIQTTLIRLCREPEKSKGWLPFHLFKPLVKSFGQDHYVSDTGDIVYYQKDPQVRS